MSDFLKGMLISAVPLVGLAILSWWFTVNGNDVATSLSLYGVFLLAAVILAIVLSLRSQRSYGAGLFVGIAIGVVAGGVSCFASVIGGI